MKIPILRIKDILLTTIQEEITDQEILKFQEDVLNTAANTAAAGIVIDVTALEVVDSYMARVLNDTANMLQLLGLEAVICGIQPSVALALVEMGRELIGVDTVLNLDQGMERIQQLVREKGSGNGQGRRSDRR